MSREEIGSNPGLKLATISRLFSRLAEAGVIEVHHRRIRLLQPDALRSIHRRSRPALVRTGHSAVAAARPAPPILETLPTLAPLWGRGTGSAVAPAAARSAPVASPAAGTAQGAMILACTEIRDRETSRYHCTAFPVQNHIKKEIHAHHPRVDSPSTSRYRTARPLRPRHPHCDRHRARPAALWLVSRSRRPFRLRPQQPGIRASAAVGTAGATAGRRRHHAVAGAPAAAVGRGAGRRGGWCWATTTPGASWIRPLWPQGSRAS